MVKAPIGFMTPPEVSRYLYVHYETVRLWMREEKLQTEKFGRFTFVYTTSVVDMARSLGMSEDNIREFAGGAMAPEEPAEKPRVFRRVARPDPIRHCPRCSARIFHNWCLVHGDQ